MQSNTSFNFINKKHRPHTTNQKILKQKNTNLININPFQQKKDQKTSYESSYQDPIKNLLYISMNFQKKINNNQQPIAAWGDQENNIIIPKQQTRPKTTIKPNRNTKTFICNKPKVNQKSISAELGEWKKRYEKETPHKINIGQQHKFLIKPCTTPKVKLFELQSHNNPYIKTFNCNTFRNSLHEIFKVNSNNANIGVLYRKIRERERRRSDVESKRRRQICSNLLGNYKRVLIIK